MSLDVPGTIWVATDSGVSNFAGGNWGYIRDSLRYPIFGTGGNTYSYKVVAVTPGVDGSVWFGLAGGGVRRYHPGSLYSVWQSYNVPDLAFGVVSGLSSDSYLYGDIWVAHPVGGISRYIPSLTLPDQGDWVIYTNATIPQILSNQIKCTSHDDVENTAWFGTLAGAFSYNASNGWTGVELPPDQTGDIVSIAIDNENTVWFGKNGGHLGVTRYNRTSGVFTSYTSANTGGKLADVGVNAVVVDKQKNRYFGTNAGLVRMADTTWSSWTNATTPELPNDTITALVFDRKGNLWVGTKGGVAVLRLSDLLPSDKVVLPSTSTGVKIPTRFQWVRDSSAATYNLKVSTSITFASPLLNTTIVNPETTYVCSSLSKGTRYYWRITSERIDTSYIWCSSQFVTTQLDVPQPTNPPANATNVDLQPALSWTSAYPTASYTVQLAFLADFSTVSKAYACGPVTNIVVDSLERATTYYWRVKGFLPGDTTFWSNVGSFTTVPALASPPALFAPQDMSTNISTKPRFLWSNVAEAISYELQVSLSPQFSTFAIDQAGISDTTFRWAQDLQPNAIYYWRIKSLNLGGGGPYSLVYRFTTGTLSDVRESGALPTEYSLTQNYPDPFNPVTWIHYQLPVLSHVSLNIYDMLGRVAVTLIDEEQVAGVKSVYWNASDFPSGVYFYRLVAGGFVETKKMVLMR